MIIRTAKPEDLDAVYRLTYDEYRRRGYCEPRADGRLNHYPHLDGIDQTTVWVAEDDGVVIGTNSITLDGPAGLHVDSDFPEAVDIIRDECYATHRRFGASWRIVTAGTFRSSVHVVLELINAAVHHSAGLVDTMLFSFNPRHQRFYELALALEFVAEARCASLSMEPEAVLMRGDAHKVLPRWQHICEQWQLPFEIDISAALSWQANNRRKSR